MDSSKMVPYMIAAQLDDEKKIANLEKLVSDMTKSLARLQNAADNDASASSAAKTPNASLQRR